MLMKYKRKFIEHPPALGCFANLQERQKDGAF
jgi:hypothetical protein